MRFQSLFSSVLLTLLISLVQLRTHKVCLKKSRWRGIFFSSLIPIASLSSSCAFTFISTFSHFRILPTHTRSSFSTSSLSSSKFHLILATVEIAHSSICGIWYLYNSFQSHISHNEWRQRTLQSTQRQKKRIN